MSDIISPIGAARHMCDVSGWSLTNLKLQKLLYIAQMFYLGKNGERLINGTFEAWDYGPVLPEVYSAVKMYGSDPIRAGFYGASTLPDGNRKALLEQAVKDLGGVSASKLVEITHQPFGAWYKAYQPGAYHIPISDEDIIAEYNARAAKKTN